MDRPQRVRVTDQGQWVHYPCPFCFERGYGRDPSAHLGVLMLKGGGYRTKCLRCGVGGVNPRHVGGFTPPIGPPPTRSAPFELGPAPGVPYLEAPRVLRAAVEAELTQTWPTVPAHAWRPLVRLWRGVLLLPVVSPWLGPTWLERRLGLGGGPRYRTRAHVLPGWLPPAPTLPGIPVVLAEGWGDALAWREAGAKAVMVVGGVNQSPAMVRDGLPWSTLAIVGFDGDAPGRHGSRMLWRSLRRGWRRAVEVLVPDGLDPAETPLPVLQALLKGVLT